jgi:ABC-2 type transport system permease protein
MNWRNVATIAAKDMHIVVARRSVRLSLILLPLGVAIGLAQVARFAGNGGIPAALLPRFLTAFLFFFAVIATMLPVAIASYSLVGEKVERSLEPLLATPATDREILLGKGLAAFVPPIAAIWAGGAVFMALSDQEARARLGHLYFPNATAVVILAVIVPLMTILSVEYSVLVSARASDVRAAQQAGILVVLPSMAVYVTAEVGAITLDVTTLGVVAGILAIVDAVLALASRATFRREEILTRWT